MLPQILLSSLLEILLHEELIHPALSPFRPRTSAVNDFACFPALATYSYDHTINITMSIMVTFYNFDPCMAFCSYKFLWLWNSLSCPTTYNSLNSLWAIILTDFLCFGSQSEYHCVKFLVKVDSHLFYLIQWSFSTLPTFHISSPSLVNILCFISTTPGSWFSFFPGSYHFQIYFDNLFSPTQILMLGLFRALMSVIFSLNDFFDDSMYSDSFRCHHYVQRFQIYLTSLDLSWTLSEYSSTTPHFKFSASYQAHKIWNSKHFYSFSAHFFSEDDWLMHRLNLEKNLKS